MSEPDFHDAHEGSNFGPLVLSVYSVASYAAFFLVNAVLARNLPIEQFNDYNVGVSTLLMLAALTPLGLEKFALKILPALNERESWAHSRGFLRFSMLTVLFVGLVLLVAFDSILESVLVLRGSDYHISIPIVVACLPFASLFFVLLEIATAYGAPLAAAGLYRVAFPLLLLVLNAAVWLSSKDMTGITASLCYAMAWILVTVAMWLLTRKMMPNQVSAAEPVYERLEWLKESTPLLLYSLLMTIMVQSGVVILQLDTTSKQDTSIFAIAMQTGAFVVALATSTNRFYLPQVSVFLERHDHEGIIRLGRQRMMLMGTLAGLFVLVVVLFGRPILRVFGEDFEKGYAATCVIAIGAAVSTLFSVAPYALQFAGRHRLVIKSSILATVASIILCAVLAGPYGSLGAAIAYSVPTVILFAYLSFSGWSQLRNASLE